MHGKCNWIDSSLWRVKEKTLLLQNTSREISGHLHNTLNIGAHGLKRAIESLAKVSDGNEILLCIELGTSIGDVFSDCIHHNIGAIQKVDRTILDMPDVLKKDVHDRALILRGGNDNDDDAIDFEHYDFQTSWSKEDSDVTSVISPCTTTSTITRQGGIQENIRALEAMTANIESSSVFTVIQRSADGFKGIEAIGIYNHLISNSIGSVQSCKDSIK